MTAIPTIVVVDDADDVRTLVRSRLRHSRRLEVIGEGASGHDAIELAERLRPDLLLLDVSMPQMDGLEALPRIREVSPDTRVVMYSGFAEQGLAERTRALGAAAFIEKSTSLDALVEDLLDVADRAGKAVAWEGPLPAVPSGSDESVLEAHLESFREVFEDAAIGMATMTLSGRVVRANASLGRLLELSVDDVVANPYAEVAGEDGDRVRTAVRRVVEEGRDVVRLEHGVIGAGPDKRILATISPVRDSTGRPLYLFLQVQDVSAQRESEEVLKLLVDSVQDYAIFLLDPQGRIATWNAVAERIKGWRADEIIGRHFREFYTPEQQGVRHPEHEHEVAIRDGRYSEEGWRMRKDGTRFWASVTITAVRDQSGRLLGFGKVTRDNTERRAAQLAQEDAAREVAAINAQLEEANARLRQTAEDQSHFLAVTAHELRSPIGVLGGSADLLYRHGEEMSRSERRDLLEGMSVSAGRLRRLLGDLLTASRINASALELSPDAVDLADQLPRIVRNSGLVKETQDVRIEVNSLSPAYADPGRLGQMVENLVANALRHGDPPVVIRTTDNGQFVQIVVTDAGGGVPEKIRDRLFARFATSSEGGTGLGLYIVRQLARAHGGDAVYRDDDGAFVITLPTANAEGARP